MAGYRPKSLDELNNLYGKAISAENEIKKSSSLLKEEVLSDIIGGEKNTQERPPRAPERRESGFSSDIDAFIRQFSGEHGASSVSETLAKKPAPQPPRPVFDGRQRSERKNESEKQENLSGLMNDYARIMSGEEDDDDEESAFSSRKPLFKNRRSDKKGKKKNSKDIIQDTSEPVKEEQPAAEKPQDAFTGESASNEFANAAFEKHESPAAADADGGFEPSYEDRLFEPAENDASKEQSEAFALPVEEDAEKADEESFDEAFEPIADGSDDFVFGSVEAPRSSGGVIFAKVVLSVLLAVTLLATVLTGIGVFSVNSERALPGGILTFCATNAYEDADIQSNDFIICKKQDYINDGEKVIYINRELRSFSFGVKNGEKTDISGNVYYKVSSEQIEKNDVLGVIVKTVPSLGKFVRIVVENYLFILLGLVTLAIVLTLILCLAFRKRRYDFYDEDFEEEESEQQEAPFEPEQENAGHAEAGSGEEDFDSDSLYSGIE